MSTIKQYDLLNMIREKCDIIGDDKSVDPTTKKIRPLNFITKLNAFILFRAMWYCDEVHDFCGKRSGFNNDEIKSFSQIRFEQMKSDNNRYFNAVSETEGLKLNLEEVIKILNNPSYNDAQKYVLRLYLNLDKDNNPLLPEGNNECYFLQVLNDLYNGKYKIEDIEPNYDIFPNLKTCDGLRLNLSKAKTAYITSNTIAHHITKTIRELFFKIINISFNDLLGCKYEFDFYKASVSSNNYLSLISDIVVEKKSPDLYLNIDPTGTGATLSPLYYTIWKEDVKNCKKNYKKNNKALKEINKINNNLIFSNTNNKVKLFITYANKWDASNDDELTAIAKTKINSSNIINTGPEAVNNIRFQIMFGTPDIFLEYQFTQDESNKLLLQIYQFCGEPLGVGWIEEGQGSVLNLANKIKVHKNYGYTVYKTCGDFLQFFTLKLYEQNSMQIDDPTEKNKIYTMLSQDLTGMDIGSLFVFNMVGCMHSGDKLKGLNLFLSDKIIKFISELKEKQPKFEEEIMGILSQDKNDKILSLFSNFFMKLPEEELKNISDEHLREIINRFIRKTRYRQDKPAKKNKKYKRIATKIFNILKKRTEFGKYKHKKSKSKKQISKSKKQKPKSKNTSKKLEKLKKEALKMGLSKSSLKQGMTKLQKNVTKLKSLAKKYRLKINRKLITNIKKCIKIHDKAKKLKIKLTKTTKSGKRLYKTPSELLREIKSKMKQNKKTKYSRKTKQNKHSKKGKR